MGTMILFTNFEILAKFCVSLFTLVFVYFCGCLTFVRNERENVWMNGFQTTRGCFNHVMCCVCVVLLMAVSLYMFMN